jgi:LysE type translocator
MRIGSSCCDNQRSFSSLHPSACFPGAARRIACSTEQNSQCRMNNCSRWQYWLRRLLHNRTQQRDRDGDHVLGVPSRFATMLIAGAAGVAALLLTYPYIAASIKWAGFAYLLFIAWQLAQPHPHATRKDSNPTGLKPLSFWQSAAFQ